MLFIILKAGLSLWLVIALIIIASKHTRQPDFTIETDKNSYDVYIEEDNDDIVFFD